MTMNSPIIAKIYPFDATQDKTIEFYYSGDQLFASKITIRRNDTNNIIYQSKQDTMQTYQVIPAHTLANGIEYNCQMVVFNHNGDHSPLSDIVRFKCLQTPIFGLEQISNNTVVKNSFLDAKIVYSQANDELLDSYRIRLYNAHKTTVVYDSGDIFASSGLTQRINGLIDGTTYHIEATGKTVSGMQLNTGYVQILCSYLKRDLYLTLEGENVPSQGAARLSSNFVSIEGEFSGQSQKYIDGTKIDLTNGDSVSLNKGYIANNFVCKAVVENIKESACFIKFDLGEFDHAYFYWRKIIENNTSYYYVDLNIKRTRLKMAADPLSQQKYEYIDLPVYVQASNRLENVLPSDKIFLFIKRVGTFWEIKISKI